MVYLYLVLISLLLLLLMLILLTDDAGKFKSRAFDGLMASLASINDSKLIADKKGEEKNFSNCAKEKCQQILDI